MRWSRIVALAGLAGMLGLVGLAQPVGPRLVTGGGPAAEPLRLERVAVEARIVGYLAETRMTLTFFNPHDRVLEGELYFPLPEGAFVSGYALDIQGVMVDGVVVEKEKGRQVFEKVVRQGIDPGLVEWVRGNNFRTRVYPIPARGRRTVAVRYVAPVLAAAGPSVYRLPLRFADPVPQFALKVEVVQWAGEPAVSGGGPAGFRFARWEERYVAESELRDARLAEDLVVVLPEAEKQKVAVEAAPDGRIYFCLADFPAPPAPVAADGAAPARVTVLWDASGSRGKESHAREFEVLKEYFGRFPAGKIEVVLAVFRNALEPPRTLEVAGGDAGPLLQALEGLAYDGGTQLGCLAGGALGARPDLYMLFSDGLSNFGPETPSLDAPVWAFGDSATADHLFLEQLARRSGGGYFNLARVAPPAAAGLVGRPVYSLLRVHPEAGSVEDLAPDLPLPVTGPVLVSGRLAAEKVRLVLEYGYPGQVRESRTVEIDGSRAARGGLVRTQWAQERIRTLLAGGERNRAELVAMGKRYGLVTPGTSLIVLDSVEQYVAHEIEPPASLPEWRQEFSRRIEARDAGRNKDRADKLESLLGQWQERVAWWETDFSKAPVKSKPRKGNGSGGGRAGTAADGRVARSENRPAEPPRPVPAEEPPAAEVRAEVESTMTATTTIEVVTTESAAGPGIAIQRWDPQTPYLKALAQAAPGRAVAVYLEQKRQFGESPGFYLDCADFFLRQGKNELGLQVLSNIAELQLENAALLRVLAHRLAQLDRLELSAAVFEQVLAIRAEEPQSHRDLALVLARLGRYERAIALLGHVIMGRWDRFDGIELIALEELNAILPRARAAGYTGEPLDPRLIRLLDLDLRIVMSWDADLTDMDLWVTEPTGQKAYYSDNRTAIGGLVSRDFTQGYGPEEYLLRKARTGTYKIEANFYGSRAQTLLGPVTVQAEVFTNFGRPNEQRRSITLRLESRNDTFKVGEVEF